MESESKNVVKFIVILIFGLLIIIFSFMYGWPKYRVWQRELAGKAELAEAEWNKKIAVEEAKANLESEKLNALSEIERAKGVAEANKIIGEGLKGNDEYLRYLWIQGLQNEHGQVIYVPTEANLPILEANRN